MLTPSPARGRCLRWLVLVTCLLSGGVLAGTAQAGTLVPCGTSGSHHTCQWRVPGNGKTGGAPVLAANGARVGYLHQGQNWILCQRTGRRDSQGAFHNNTWGYTTADNGKKGWVNALWAHGGDNDSGFAGTPQCAASYGAPPGGSGSTPPAKPKPTPPTKPTPPAKPSGPAQVPCKAIGKGRHQCSWRVAGNGKTGGTPVLAANGARVGYLHQGQNWILCQRTGREQSSGAAHNDVWGYTTADNGKKGWANALWAHGGANDGGFSGTPQCPASYGSPPSGTSKPPTPSPKPSPDSCAHTREDQTATITFSYLETRRHIILPGNVAQPPASKNDAKPKHHGFGTITVGGGTCKSPTGWRALKNVSIHEDPSGLYKDGGGHASIKGSGSAKGWGFGIAAARDGSFDVQQTACRKGSGWAIVKALVSLPIKGLPYVGSLAKFAVGKLIPSDGTKCDDMGVARISLSADSTGRLVLRSAPLSQGSIVERSYDDPHKTGDFHEHSRVPDPPKISVRTR